MTIDTLTALRALFPEPKERAIKKQLAALDVHCIRFIGLSPFLVLATAGASGNMDASPRGGAPGFVKVLDANTLLIPDAPGNNRLDSLENIVAIRRAGIIFMVPGVDETLRINGLAELSVDAQDLQRCADQRRTPRLVIRVTVREAYLHCAKALLRSHLWDPAHHVQRDALPTVGQMLSDHTGIDVPPETQDEMRKRYEPDL
jgi:uncharacterized protein